MEKPEVWKEIRHCQRKRKYAHVNEARVVAREIYNTSGAISWYYECKYCGCLHITSKPYKNNQLIHPIRRINGKSK